MRYINFALSNGLDYQTPKIIILLKPSRKKHQASSGTKKKLFLLNDFFAAKKLDWKVGNIVDRELGGGRKDLQAKLLRHWGNSSGEKYPSAFFSQFV